MARRVRYSFHYDADNWRASQVRNTGVVDGNRPASDNDWETVKHGGDPARLAWLAVIPTLSFWFLDAYYLGLEKGFRGTHSTFVRKMHDGTASTTELFQVVPEGGPGHLTWAAVRSVSVWPFYIALLLVTGLAGIFVIG
jgi:hypothetical protein